MPPAPSYATAPEWSQDPSGADRRCVLATRTPRPAPSPSVIQSVARLPHARRCPVILRADRAFDITALYAECERRGWHYVVKLRVMADIAARIWAQATAGRWRRIHDDGDMPIEVSEARVHRKCWGQARRVVLQRRRDPENPQGHHTRTSEDAV